MCVRACVSICYRKYVVYVCLCVSIDVHVGPMQFLLCVLISQEKKNERWVKRVMGILSSFLCNCKTTSYFQVHYCFIYLKYHQ